MIARQRLYLTADKAAVVAAGDKRAAFLYCVPGDEIPASAAQIFGLVDGALPVKGKGTPPGGNKEKKGGEDKEKKSDDDKGGEEKRGEEKGGKDKGGEEKAPGDDLTRIKGIGNATAKALADAGIASLAALAALDPQQPPLMIPGKGEADWLKWVAAARELAPADAGA
ncbi:helix-hairpin-helix domain-containing protein [Polymorphum gilvum]|uniref:DUF4332 domain-containing protein n=1 Tax=Polymorphum gilvum (strain LMG 25793 / CGMCC 1.9160 / SL003B-26A1) TaxID=991905 RepID=F2J5M8_POLGS|nr:helix-hairpin-helix domain-containing protein [Polymorphum gilvum]ADZ70112.1 hypothetical protein SL003B_1684 [Polymorphum gilvum SL003B-26A1]